MKQLPNKINGYIDELGMEVVGFRLLGKNDNFPIFRESADFFCDGQILDYKTYYKRKLEKGYGVIYNDYILFKKNAGSITYKNFIKEYHEQTKEAKAFMKGRLYEALFDVYNFEMMKGLLLSAKNSFMSVEQLREKLYQYGESSKMDILLKECL
ncbi:hypothetical protein [Bacillus sp. NPDC094106]|uniref:hypothetical protein n=1 Tax=Bacillus sp. NPDC094106 TaxID=3363949 RepID=UPI00380703DB